MFMGKDFSESSKLPPAFFMPRASEESNSQVENQLIEDINELRKNFRQKAEGAKPHEYQFLCRELWTKEAELKKLRNSRSTHNEKEANASLYDVQTLRLLLENKVERRDNDVDDLNDALDLALGGFEFYVDRPTDTADFLKKSYYYAWLKGLPVNIIETIGAEKIVEVLGADESRKMASDVIFRLIENQKGKTALNYEGKSFKNNGSFRESIPLGGTEFITALKDANTLFVTAGGGSKWEEAIQEMEDVNKAA